MGGEGEWRGGEKGKGEGVGEWRARRKEWGRIREKKRGGDRNQTGKGEGDEEEYGGRGIEEGEEGEEERQEKEGRGEYMAQVGIEEITFGPRGRRKGSI